MFKTLFTFTAGLITGVVATKVYEKDASFSIPILNRGCVKKPDEKKIETEVKGEPSKQDPEVHSSAETE